jgi:O-antigen/teichoic acid export membrane protein
MSHFRINVVANYTSLLYTTAISLLFMPLLHDELGAEFFGLVGIYVLLTNVLSILDFGLVSTVSRECAVSRGDVRASSRLIPVIRSAERVMLGIGFIAVVIFMLMSDYIALRWMNFTTASATAVVDCFRFIVASIVIRWLAGLYRGILNGFEEQLVTSGVNALTATLRFPVSYILVVSVGASKALYFELQLVIAVIEFAVLLLLSRRATATLVPDAMDRAEARALLRKTLGFSAAVALLAVLTMLFTQLDKLLLSKTLQMSDFGDFSLIASLAMGVSTLGGPMAMALIPRLSNLNANARTDDFFHDYLKSIRLMLILIVPAGAVLALFGRQVLYAWTGGAELAERMAGTLSVYVVGNCLWVMAAFPGYLKYAKGDIRYLILYNLLSLLVYVPVAIYIAPVYGAQGIAYVWLVVNALMLVACHLFVHPEFFDVRKRRMVVSEVISSIVLAVVVLLALGQVMPWSGSRFILAAQVAAAAACAAASLHVLLHRRGSFLRSAD